MKVNNYSTQITLITFALSKMKICVLWLWFKWEYVIGEWLYFDVMIIFTSNETKIQIFFDIDRAS